MSEIGGYLATMGYDLHERIESDGSFRETVRLPDLRYREAHVCFISFDGESIAYAGLLTRQRKVTPTKCVAEFSNFVELGHLTPARILDNTSPRGGPYVVLPAIETVYAVPDSTWLHLMNAIKRLRPGAASRLSALEDLARPYSQTQEARGYDAMAEEKDAIGLAMSIFGVDRDMELRDWGLSTGEPAPFIRGLKSVSLREDTLINHDASVFGSEWERFKDYQVGAVEFHRRRSNQHLTIMNVNRTCVERTIGVDLLYYHHTYQSFVMVQYKRMTEGIYRPTDLTYHNETSRMREIETDSPDIHKTEAEGLESYRLNHGAFYFKLCPSTVFTPLSTDLIEGMYLPLDYWDILEQLPEARGKRGGLAITRKNMGRHLNNTLFIHLVQDGWIGSRLSKTGQLVRLIQELLEQDRSVVVAISA